ncbi:hypothetical protein HELRODRAFT_64342 [Helobdella robusta]|uniref:USP domain-containing protein n=1 Tax=Helobdella robusta TaxID=6412 RepID=T1FXT0_HELRO|nr:hypothetical protein HELRODRAFT_64342 [Helobdella robusta]ESO06419.1 hypothetical protein HELRODRAFT_64342 [Helobdella robusta]
MRNHDCVEGSCIYCALQDIFREFKESDENTLNPDMLRLTLACSFQDQDKFQLGQLDDAAECYEKILSRIHFHLSGGASDDFCSLGHCITHVKFAMSLIQQTLCQCSATSEPLPYVQLVDYVSTLSIMSAIECSKMMKTNDFSELLRYAFNYEMSSTCPLKCGLKSRTVRTLVNCPDVVSIGLIWNSDQPDPDHIREFVSTIGEHVTLHKVCFNTTESSVRELVGVVCYYFKHYSTFFKRSKDGRWISFDDASVSEIGDTWDKVIDKCCKGKYQPLLLIYQNKQAELINTKTAPKKTSFIVKCMCV